MSHFVLRLRKKLQAVSESDSFIESIYFISMYVIKFTPCIEHKTITRLNGVHVAGDHSGHFSNR